METTVKMSSVANVFDSYSGVCLADTGETIQANLSSDELLRYCHAMMKVEKQQVLNRKDLAVLDKIDAITFEHHGMCLKDSLVTKARLKACKKYGVNFIDRDGLIDHMSAMTSTHSSNNLDVTESELNLQIGYFLLDRLGESRFQDFSLTIGRVLKKQPLSRKDLEVIYEVESLFLEELDSSTRSGALQSAIDEACERLCLDFESLGQKTFH